jgi:hypothetical protein
LRNSRQRKEPRKLKELKSKSLSKRRRARKSLGWGEKLRVVGQPMFFDPAVYLIFKFHPDLIITDPAAFTNALNFCGIFHA